MAHGTKCKLDLTDITNLKIPYTCRAFTELRRRGWTKKCYLMELTYEAAFSNGAAEIGIPNGVFDGTSNEIPLGVSSASANDDSAGVGIQTINLLGLSSADAFFNTSYTMDGTTVIPIDTYPHRLMHMKSLTTGANNDAEGNIIIFTRAHDKMTDITETGTTREAVALLASGLTAATQYYFKLNIDGGGVTEYDITTGTDVTWGAVLALIETEIGTAGAECKFLNLDDTMTLCFISDSGTSIATTAGSTGTDLLATAGGTTAANVAKAGHLQIAATFNESEGSALWIPEDYGIAFAMIDLLITTAANANSAVAVRIQGVDFDSCGTDPDFKYIPFRQSTNSSPKAEELECYWLSDGETTSKIHFTETYLGGAESGYVNIKGYVFSTSDIFKG